MDEYEAEIIDQYGDIALKEIDSLWSLAEDFNVNDASALIAGYNPTTIERRSSDTFFNEVFPKYPIAFEALTNAIIQEKLTARLVYQRPEKSIFDQDSDILDSSESTSNRETPDWASTTIARDDLIAWLRSRGIQTGFFFPNQENIANYLNPDHPRYAPKLAAAVNAWLALDDAALLKGKSPKQALSKWLRENAADYKLSDDEGKPNETGIEECAKVANWQDKGGAPKTPLD